MNLSIRNLLRKAASCIAGLVFLLPLTMTALAQEPQRITFDDALRIALDQNYQIKQLSNAVRMAEIEVSSARAAFLPSFSVGANGGRSFGLSFDTNVGELRTTAYDRFNIGASTGLTLFNGFSDFARLRQSQLSVTASDLDLERGRQFIVFQVASQFLNYVAQRELIVVRQENLVAQQQLLSQIEEFVRAGSRPMSDLYGQRAAVASAEMSIIEAERASQIAEANVIQTLQLDPLGSYEFVIPEESDLSLAPVDYNLDELITSAMSRRADLRASEVSIDASWQGIRQSRAGRLPSVSMSASAGTSYNSGIGLNFGDQFNNNRSQSIGLNLSIPVFSRRQTSSQIQRAYVQYANAQLGLENLRQQVGVEVRTAYLDYITAEKSLEVTEQQLVWREQALEAERERYNVGAATLVELSQAQSDYVQAASDRVSARYTFFVRKRLIDYYTGVLDPTQPILE